VNRCPFVDVDLNLWPKMNRTKIWNRQFVIMEFGSMLLKVVMLYWAICLYSILKTYSSDFLSFSMWLRINYMLFKLIFVQNSFLFLQNIILKEQNMTVSTVGQTTYFSIYFIINIVTNNSFFFHWCRVFKGSYELL